MRVGRMNINPIDAMLAVLLPVTAIGLYTEFYDPVTPEEVIHAMASGDYELVRDHLDSDFDFLAQDEDGRTLLHAAAERGNAAMAITVLHHGGGVALTLFDKEGFTPVHRAVNRHHFSLGGDPTQLLRAFLHNGTDPNLVTAYGERLVETAIKSGNEGLVFELLNAGADLDTVHIGGKPLIQYVAQHSMWRLLNHLLEAGRTADFGSFDDNQLSLARAIQDRSVLGVELLLGHGVDPNVPFQIGMGYTTRSIGRGGRGGRMGRIMRGGFRDRDGTHFTHLFTRGNDMVFRVGPRLIQPGLREDLEHQFQSLPLDYALWLDRECASTLIANGARAEVFPRILTTVRYH